MSAACDYTSRRILTEFDVLWGSLLILGVESWVNVREAGKVSGGGVSEVALDGREVLGTTGEYSSEQSAARYVGVVVLPGDAVGVELVEDKAAGPEIRAATADDGSLTRPAEVPAIR